MAEEVESECRSLLPSEAGEGPAGSTHILNTHGFRMPRAAICCIGLYFLVEMYDMITVAPLTALLEQALCRAYYRDRDPSLIKPGGHIQERFCKLEFIQSELAVVRGWKLAFDAIPGFAKLNLTSSRGLANASEVFFVALPFGRLADHIGRAKVFALSIAGLTLGTVWILVICKPAFHRRRNYIVSGTD